MLITWPDVAIAAMFLLCLTALFAWVAVWNVFRSIAKYGIDKAAQEGGSFTMGEKKDEKTK